MSLKAVVDTLDAVEEPFRSLYAEKDGKFHLAVEGLVPKSRVDEFRDTNIALKRQMDELTAKFDGIDPEVARELAAKAAKDRDKKLIDAGKVEELLAERVGAMKTEYETRLKAEESAKTTLTKQLEGLLIDNAIRDAAAKSGVRATAIDDVLLRGQRIFRLQDGKAVPMEGDKVIFGKNGDPMPIDEWVSGLTERAPHLFEPSQGGGSRNGTGNSNTGAGRVSRDDAASFLSNLDAIAKGAVKVA
ncbi:MAG TPA: hypothetical protein PLT25_06270 [Acidocella sp.]|nr:hypothetical protein [Acidocella sp.]